MIKMTLADINDVNIAYLIDMQRKKFRSSIIHIKPHIKDTENNWVLYRYIDRIKKICNDLFIEYIPSFLESDATGVYNAVKSSIIGLNVNNSMDGIIVGCPFGADRFYHGYVEETISPIKDVECVTTTNLIKYINNKESKIVPPLAFIKDYLSMMHIVDSNRKCLIIRDDTMKYIQILSTSTLNEQYDIISFNSIDKSKLYKYDIIVSFAEDDSTLENIQFDAKLLLNFSSVKNPAMVNLNSDGVTYTLETGLLDLYAYGVMRNLLNLK